MTPKHPTSEAVSSASTNASTNANATGTQTSPPEHALADRAFTPGPPSERAVSRHGTFLVPLVATFAIAGAASSVLTELLSITSHSASPSLWHRVLWVLVSGAVAGAFGLYMGQLSKAALRPISHAAAIWKAGGLRYRIPHETGDELGDLATSLNALADHHEAEVRALTRLVDERAKLSRDAARAAVLEERQRLARELHDAVSQAVFSIVMMSAAARRLLPDHPEKAAHELEEVSRTAQIAQREMRALLLELRPIELSGRPLSEGLRVFLDEVASRHGVDTRYEAPPTLEGAAPLPPAVEDGLFRIAQEGVANAVRHAHPSLVRVELEILPELRRVRLMIADDGQGFDPEKPAPDGHYGLGSIQERCAEMGGRLRIESRPARERTRGGTTLWVEVPLMGRDAPVVPTR